MCADVPSTHTLAAIRVGKVCGASDGIFDLCEGAKSTIGASGRKQLALLKGPDKR